MFSHESLHADALRAAKSEKSATLVLLETLIKVEEHRTYAVMGYPSIFKYVEEALHYSPSQTSERLSAMRLLKKVPEIAQTITNGAHSLTSVMKIATHVKRENLNAREAATLVQETSHKTVVSIEKHLLGLAVVEPAKQERTKVISKELTRITVDVDDEFMATVQRIRELRGNPSLPLSEIFEHAMKELIKKQEAKKGISSNESKSKNEIDRNEKSNPKGHEEKAHSKPNPSRTSVTEATPYRTRYIRIKDRRAVHARAEGQCEYVHAPSGKRCGSKLSPQFDHLIAFSKGGGSHAGNLQCLCPTHNRLKAIREFGERKMRPYLRR